MECELYLNKAAFFEKWIINGNEPDISFHIFILKELSFGTYIVNILSF